MIMLNQLPNKDFLQQLDYQNIKETYARITLLNNDYSPLDQLEGKITQGSINIDGTSAVRRTCNFSLAIDKNNRLIDHTIWVYNTLFRVEVGLKNYVDKNYPDIIWFDQGIYVVTSFGLSESTTSIKVSIQGKDKMCRLNGTIGGNLGMDVNFAVVEKEDRTDRLTLYEIIHYAMRVFGQETFENIVVNDLEQNGYELQKYCGDQPMYYIIDSEPKKVINISFDSNTKVYLATGNDTTLGVLDNYYSYNTIIPEINENADKVTFTQADESMWYYIAKIQYGESAGYRKTKLTYTSDDLTIAAGSPITALFDKIVSMLGEYEYFYDLSGRFVFQKKNTYIQELFSPISGGTITPVLISSPYSYQFDNENLFTAKSSNPNIDNLKNDFTVWGNRKSITGNQLPIHARCVLSKKPLMYVSIETGNEYLAGEYDWRELVYQMAKDWNKYGLTDSNFLQKIEQANPQYIGGYTGYEQYYTDFLGFWRQLYDPWGDPLEYYPKGHLYEYWNKKIHTEPSGIDFWFDILEVAGELDKYSIMHYNEIDQNNWFYSKNVGSRTKVVKENAVKSIYYNEIPEVLLVYPGETGDTSNAFTNIQIQENAKSLFTISSQGLSAISKINSLVQQHLGQIEGLNITSIPIYYLQPNYRIRVLDKGDYVLKAISYNLNYNGTMTLSCDKIIENFY